jgi:hypothetical protein
MDKEEELIKILGKLSGRSIEDIADKIIALFRAPEWWEEAFDEKFVARGSMVDFKDLEKCDAVKSFISTLITRVKQEERQKFIMEIESVRDTFLEVVGSSEDTMIAMKLYSFLLSDLRQKYSTPQEKQDSV